MTPLNILRAIAALTKIATYTLFVVASMTILQLTRGRINPNE